MIRISLLWIVLGSLICTSAHAVKWKGREMSDNVEDRRNEFITETEIALTRAEIVLENRDSTVQEVGLAYMGVQVALLMRGNQLESDATQDLLKATVLTFEKLQARAKKFVSPKADTLKLLGAALKDAGRMLESRTGTPMPVFAETYMAVDLFTRMSLPQLKKMGGDGQRIIRMTQSMIAVMTQSLLGINSPNQAQMGLVSGEEAVTFRF